MSSKTQTLYVYSDECQGKNSLQGKNLYLGTEVNNLYTNLQMKGSEIKWSNYGKIFKKSKNEMKFMCTVLQTMQKVLVV